jgi:hypothetical protein
MVQVSLMKWPFPNRASLRMRISNNLFDAAKWCLEQAEARQGKRPVETLGLLKGLLVVLACWFGPRWEVMTHKNQTWTAAWVPVNGKTPPIDPPLTHMIMLPDGQLMFAVTITA